MTTLKFFLSLLLTSATIVTVAQNKSSTTGQRLFEDGVYLENLRLTIPWNVDVSDLSKYGNPTITTTSKNSLNVLWSTVTILNGVKADLKYNSKKQSNGSYSKLTDIYASFDTSDTEKVVNTIMTNTNSVPKTKVTKSVARYSWTFKDCLVRVSKGPNIGLLLVQRGKNGM